LITDGYDNREGLTTVLDGLTRILTMHARYRVPFNLHLSGTLIEAAAWLRPQFLQTVRALFDDGMLEPVGSCYGQNIMRFFRPEYNRRQLQEELQLYTFHLGVQPKDVKVFWPPERVWETRSMAPSLRDATLLNEGYRYVILDDRLLHSRNDAALTREEFDKGDVWSEELHQMHEIDGGLGLMAFPISTRLRHSIPLRCKDDWTRIRAELEGLLVRAATEESDGLLAIYADDMEKVAGLWGAEATEAYDALLQWISENRWIESVRLSAWADGRRSDRPVKIERGAFAELARDFEAGESYECWYFAPDWAPYRGYFEWTQKRVAEMNRLGADPALMELATKQLLLSNWETAWHTPPGGPHGDPDQNGHASPWARALTSHCRHAAATAEAAHWMRYKDGLAHAALVDIDNDGETELILRNSHLFTVVTPRWGGRVVALFRVSGERGAMLIGNPCDDWNWMEELNRYMETPPNHPGAFADVSFENEPYEAEIAQASGDEVAVTLRSARGIAKEFRMQASGPHLAVHYSLPGNFDRFQVEFALSPDYLRLLREGSAPVRDVQLEDWRGCATREFAVWVRPQPTLAWREPRQPKVGHGCLLSVEASVPEFWIEIGSALLETEDAPNQKAGDLEPALL
jgi:hypothetical protein